jgi:hypothetical protein
MVPEPWSTVHDPMPDGDWRRHLGVVQKPKDSNDRFPLTRKGRGLKVDVIPASETMIGNRQQAIGVRCQIDANNVGALVRDMISQLRIAAAVIIVGGRDQPYVSLGNNRPKKIRRYENPHPPTFRCRAIER